MLKSPQLIDRPNGYRGGNEFWDPALGMAPTRRASRRNEDGKFINKYILITDSNYQTIKSRSESIPHNNCVNIKQPLSAYLQCKIT
jgi:hypothetical protein